MGVDPPKGRRLAYIGWNPRQIEIRQGLCYQVAEMGSSRGPQLIAMSDVKSPGEPPAPPKNVSGTPDSSSGDFAKLQYSQELEAWLEKWKQEISQLAVRTALEASRADADRAAEVALIKSMHDAYISVTQSSIDRSLTRTNVVTASIGAVTTVYTGLLALVYADKHGSGRALTVAAIVPALFLGMALFLVTIYASAFKNSSSEQGPLLPSGTGDPIVEYRLNTFMEWCFATVGSRTWALQAGIVSLGIGVACLPIPFVKLTGYQQLGIFIAGLVAIISSGLVVACRSRRNLAAETTPEDESLGERGPSA
jgi:hypothetical protein